VARRRIVARALDVLRADGLRALWFKILAATVYRRMIVIERLLGEPLAEVTVAMATPVTVRVLTMDEIAEYVRFRPSASAADVTSLLAGGDLCFAVWSEGCIVNALWVTMKPSRIDYLDADLEIAPGDVYAYANFTAPEFRNRNLATFRGAEVIRYFKERGYFRIMAVIIPENKASIRNGEKIGYRRIGLIGCFKAGRFRHDFCRIKGTSRPIGYPARTGAPASPAVQL
jgi:hypothetical protein